MRNSKKYRKVPDQSDTCLRAEEDVPTNDRISMQPVLALLDVLGELEDEPDLQVRRQTWQTWRVGLGSGWLLSKSERNWAIP